MTFDDIAKPWIRGLGIYEPGRPISEVARELGFADERAIVKLASNENALGPSPRALRAMRRGLTQAHLYPDGGAFYLRQALARRLDVAADTIVVGSGSNELLEFIGHVFLGPGTSIVMADRAFVVYRLVAAAERAETIAVPMRDHTHDLDAMLAAIRPDTRVVYLANPNNPTGTMVDDAAIARFMARVPDHVVVCFDEAYIELLDPERQPDTLRYVREDRKAIVLRTFSKTYGLAGLRVGYGVMPPACAALLHRVRQPFNVNALALDAACAALEDEGFVLRTRRMVRAGLRQLERGLKRLGVPYVPAVTNFMLVEVGEGRRVFDDLQRAGVIVRPMDGYGLPRFVRVTVGKPAENRRFLEALTRVLGR